MGGGVRFHFTKSVHDYDTVAGKVVMKNDELHNLLVESIPFDTGRELNVLDLGCGTAHGMSLIAEKFPNARISGVDFSSVMVGKAKRALEKFSGRAKLIEKDFSEMEFNERYDAVISAVAIHNITHAQKDALFGKIYNALNPGGIFINGDFIAGETPEMDKQYRSEYRQYLEKNMSGAELETWLKHAFEEDMPMALSGQQELLAKHGFRGIKTVWQFCNEAIYTAEKQ